MKTPLRVPVIGHSRQQFLHRSLTTEDQKLRLFDDCSSFDECVYIGEVSPEIINQKKKANCRGSSCQHSFTNQLRADGKMRRLAKRLSGDLASVGA